MLKLVKKPALQLNLVQQDYVEIIGDTLSVVREQLGLMAEIRPSSDFWMLDLDGGPDLDHHLDAKIIEHDGGIGAQFQLCRLGVGVGGYWPTWVVYEKLNAKGPLLHVAYKQRNHFTHQLTLDERLLPPKNMARLGGRSFLLHLVESAHSFVKPIE